MNRLELVRELQAAVERNADVESAHSQADRAIAEWLDDEDPEIAELYRAVKKWYA